MGTNHKRDVFWTVEGRKWSKAPPPPSLRPLTPMCRVNCVHSSILTTHCAYINYFMSHREWRFLVPCFLDALRQGLQASWACYICQHPGNLPCIPSNGHPIFILLHYPSRVVNIYLLKPMYIYFEKNSIRHICLNLPNEYIHHRGKCVGGLVLLLYNFFMQ